MAPSAVIVNPRHLADRRGFYAVPLRCFAGLSLRGTTTILTSSRPGYYIFLHMGNSLATKILTAVAVGVVLLGHLSPVAAGMLLCIGDGNDPDCCPERQDSRESRLGESTRCLDGPECACCITVDAAPCTAGASSHRTPLDVASGSVLSRSAALPTGTRIPGAPTGDAGETSLSSLRTVVLLI